ncbi:MAG: ABC transporter ATP-binding protein/permease [Actinomycetota bacterium]|nr:ABC transporter ATP-binding protein/permease [Actinomycetota bacterium]
MSAAALPPVLARERLGPLGRLVLIGLARAGTHLATALLVKAAVNRAVQPGRAAWDGWTSVSFGAGLALAALVAAGLRSAERVEAERLGQSYAHRLRLVLYDHMSQISPRVLQRRSQGGVALRFVGDVTAVRQWVSLGLARLTVAAVATAAGVAMLAWLSLRLAIVLSVVLLAGGAAALAGGGRLRQASVETRRCRSRLAANVTEQAAWMSVVQAFGQGARERKRLARQARRLRDAMIERARWAGRLQGLAEATVALASAGVLLVGGAEVASGRMTMGTMVAAITVAGLVATPLRDLGRVQEYWHNSRVAMDKARDFLTVPALGPSGAFTGVGLGRVEFEDVCVPGALDGVSSTAEAGTVVAIVGRNGAGKSTLLAAAARLVEPTRGTVSLDGVDLRSLETSSLRATLGVMGPDLPLLRGSVERNLRYRCPDAPPEELARVAELCALDEFLAELPDGMATRLAEGGRGLSDGQRQAIALARALVGSPAVLLLDEADMNLDARAAAVVDRVIDQHQGTVLLATHRLERVRRANAVWCLEGGRLVEVGRPEELLARGGPTTRLFEGPGPALTPAHDGPVVDVTDERGQPLLPADGSRSKPSTHPA